MLEAIIRIREDIDNPQAAYIKQLASFVLNNCYVIQVTARDLDDGYVLFRSLNSRGQPLNELDLARAELLGAQSPGKETDIDTLAEAWNEPKAIWARRNSRTISSRCCPSSPRDRSAAICAT